MKFFTCATLLLNIPVIAGAGLAGYAKSQDQGVAQARSKHLRPVLEKRQQFSKGQPINAQGNGAPILGKYPPVLAMPEM